MVSREWVERQFLRFRDQVLNPKFLRISKFKVNGTSVTPTEEMEVNIEIPDISGKVDKEVGKGLSTNDFTTEDKNKLDGVTAGAAPNVQADWNVTDSSSDAFIKNKPVIPEGVVVDSELSSSSTNALQNKVITEALSNKADETTITSILDSSIIDSFGDVETALDSKVDKVTGKGLSTNDYDTTAKTKLDNLVTINSIGTGLALNSSTGELSTDIVEMTLDEYNALTEEEKGDGTIRYITDYPASISRVTIDDEMSSSSENPVQNKVIASALNDKVDKITGKGLSTEDYTSVEKTKLSEIAVGADVNTIESITLNGTAVTPDSNKNVALTVITKAVDDLVNYYTKSQSYTKTEVDALISAIVTLDIQTVNALPTENISTTTIYLVPSADPQTQNAKDEYINTTGTTEGWEIIGSTAIDLTGYVTTSDLNTALADYVTTTNLTTLLAAKADASDVTAIQDVIPSTASSSNKLATVSDVPSTTNFVQKSSTAGLIKNDGTVDTNNYADLSTIVAEFDPTETYEAESDFVSYNGQIYICTDNHTGAWNSSDFAVTDLGSYVGFVNEMKLSVVQVVPAFDASTSYAVGDYVRRKISAGEYWIFKCITAHTGAWDGNHFRHVLISDEIKNVVSTKADNVTSFTEASTRANINSGETIPTILGKIKKFFTDLKTVAFSGDYWDLSNAPQIIHNTGLTCIGTSYSENYYLLFETSSKFPQYYYNYFPFVIEGTISAFNGDTQKMDVEFFNIAIDLDYARNAPTRSCISGQRFGVNNGEIAYFALYKETSTDNKIKYRIYLRLTNLNGYVEYTIKNFPNRMGDNTIYKNPTRYSAPVGTLIHKSSDLSMMS